MRVRVKALLDQAPQLGITGHFGSLVDVAHGAERSGAQAHPLQVSAQDAAGHRLAEGYLVQLFQPVRFRQALPFVVTGGNRQQLFFVLLVPGAAQGGRPIGQQAGRVRLQCCAIGQHQPGLHGYAAHGIRASACIQLLHGDGGPRIAAAADGPGQAVILHGVAARDQVDHGGHGATQAALANAPDDAVAVVLVELFPVRGLQLLQQRNGGGIRWILGGGWRWRRALRHGRLRDGRRIAEALRGAFDQRQFEQGFGGLPVDRLRRARALTPFFAGASLAQVDQVAAWGSGHCARHLA